MRKSMKAARWLLVLSLGVLSAGCARASMMPENQADATLRVENHNFNDVDIFAVHPGGTPQRVGQVTGLSSGTITLPRALIASVPIRFVAVPIGGFGAAGSGSLTVYGGQTITFTIESDLAMSSAVVR